jgi:ABC-type uncharacterized transport system permease subunit
VLFFHLLFFCSAYFWRSVGIGNDEENPERWTRILKVAVFALLFAVPLALYRAADPTNYPAVNPDTGGRRE